jgi:hypothetical protein
MPGLDGTGPSGKGPMTGKVQGFCVLTHTEGDTGQVKGFVGLQGVPVDQQIGNVENTERRFIMPGGDGTGPAGMGSMTGRAMGSCAGNTVQGSAYPAGARGYFGRGRGRGFGRGYGRGRAGFGVPPYVGAPFAPSMTAQQELDELKGQAEYLEESLGGIRKRIEELDKQNM